MADWIDEHHIDSVGDYWIVAGTHFWLKAEYWIPTTDIAQAWQVLEKFPAPKYLVSVQTTMSEEWLCEIALMETEMPDSLCIPSIMRVSKSAPRAICNASLATIESN